MRSHELHQLSAKIAIGLSLTALLTVLSGYTLPRPLPADEGTAAHVFQLSIVALAATVVLFVATTDWRQPWRGARTMGVSAVLTLAAFGALYYLEHYR